MIAEYKIMTNNVDCQGETMTILFLKDHTRFFR